MTSIEALDWAHTAKSPRLRLYYWMCRARAAEACLWICVGRRKRNRAEHIRRLEAKIERQAKALTYKEEAIVLRNKLWMDKTLDGVNDEATMADSE